MALDKNKLMSLMKKIADNDLQNESYSGHEMLNDDGDLTEKLLPQEQVKYDNIQKFVDFMFKVKYYVPQTLGTNAYERLKENDFENIPDWLKERFDLPEFKINFEDSFTNEELDDFDKALDHCIELKKTANPEKPLISNDFNDKSNTAVKDSFWSNFGKKPFDKDDINYYNEKLLKLQEKGIDIHEYDQWNNYLDYKRKNNVLSNTHDPITLLDMINDPEKHEQLLDEEFRNNISKGSIDKFLNTVETLYNEKGERWADFTDIEDIAGWVRGFKMPVFIDGKETEKGVIEFGVSMSGIDRDNAANYDETLLAKAKEYFSNPENQNTIRWVKEKADVLSNSQSQVVLADAMESVKKMSDKTMDQVNGFRHILYDMKENYKRAKAIKLGDDKNPKYVDEFEKGDNISSDRINKREQDALDTCYEMLKNAKSPKWNSKEYNQIMTDIVNAKKILQNNELEPTAKQEQYKKAVEGVIGDIGNYYAHKAVKGETEFSTNHKYKALFRVEKLMKSRYEGMTPDKENAFEADFNTGGAFSINDDDIDPEVVGDEYAKQVTQSKVKNIVKLKDKVLEGRKTVGAANELNQPEPEKVSENGRKSMGPMSN